MSTEQESRFVGEYYTTKENACMTCRHRSTVDPTLCLAFPSGIPSAILMGDNDHRQPVTGDHGIQYQSK